MPYASACDVAGLCQNILGGVDRFLTSTCPTLTQVNQWLSSGCGILESRIAGKGYDVPVASTVQAYDWLRGLNALYGAAFVEMSRTNVTLAPGERTRGQYFYEIFWEELEKFLDMDLTMVGVSRSSDGVLYAGGISISDKQTYETDTDRVTPKFLKGLFDFQGTLSPTKTTAS